MRIRGLKILEDSNSASHKKEKQVSLTQTILKYNNTPCIIFSRANPPSVVSSSNRASSATDIFFCLGMTLSSARLISSNVELSKGSTLLGSGAAFEAVDL